MGATIALELILILVILAIIHISLMLRKIECNRLANYLSVTALFGITYFNVAYHYGQPQQRPSEINANSLESLSARLDNEPELNDEFNIRRPALVQSVEIFVSDGLFFWALAQLAFSISIDKLKDWTQPPTESVDA